MAEGKKDETSGASWWGSWLAVAKEQTEKAFEMVSNDLTEFTNTMQTDTKKIVDKTKETLQPEGGENVTATDKMKQSFHSLMTGITKALTVEPEDTSPPRGKSPSQHVGPHIIDRAQARLRAIQVDTGTYLKEPSGPPQQYANWLKSFDFEKHKGQISDLLVTMVEVRSLYTTLVPSEVSHQDFWRRYFYKLHQLELDEARKQALMMRAERAHVKEDSIGWDEEEWSGDEAGGKQRQKQLTDDTSNVGKPDAESRLQPEVAEKSTTYETRQVRGSGKDSHTEHSEHAGTQSVVVETGVANKEQSEHTGTQSVVVETGVANKDREPVQTEAIPGEIHKEQERLPHDAVSEVAIPDKIHKSADSMDTLCDNDKTVAGNAEVKIAEKISEDTGSIHAEIGEDTGSIHAEIGATGADLPAKLGEQVIDKVEEITEEKCVDAESVDGGDTTEMELKTKVKGDMVVVGESVSPSSESSGNKESGTEDWEQDFDVDITAEDMAAASELAQKLNMTATEYNTLTGEDEDWENWD